MSKLLVSGLVLSSLLMLAHCTESETEVIVKDGHCVVVVEYDRDGKTNTRVLIKPPGKEEEKIRDKGEMFENAKREIASSLSVEKEREHHASPGELICDALGKCKHKMEHVLGRVKDLTHDVEPMNERVTNKAQKALKHLRKGKDRSARIGTIVQVALGLSKIGTVIGLVGIAAAYGMCVWMTLVSGYILASVLRRQQLGVVQSKIFSVYFKAVSVGILVGLLGHVISRGRKVFTNAVDMWQAVNLLSSILMVEANASFVGPRLNKAMVERIKAEKEDGRGLESQSRTARTMGKKVKEKVDEDSVEQRLRKLSERQCRLNAYTWRLNLLTLLSLTWHFVYLGHRLRCCSFRLLAAVASFSNELLFVYFKLYSVASYCN